MGDDDGDFGQTLFALMVWRELERGNITPGCIFRFFGIGLAIAGAGLLLIALIGSPATPRDVSAPWSQSPAPYVTAAPVARVTPPPAPGPTQRPATLPPVLATPSSPVGPTPAATPQSVAVGVLAATSDGWQVRVDKVQRWRPSWYHEPGWRLVTIYVSVRMPMLEGCAFSDMFTLIASSGQTYSAWTYPERQPSLFACSDYHRVTWAKAWLTFEVRDADAKGLRMLACVPEMISCEYGREFSLS